MSEQFDLKPISQDAITEAVRRAEHYRLLNDPEQAESICLDILAVQPDHQQALVILILAMTDQFGKGTLRDNHRVQDYLGKLEDEYKKNYYAGIVSERHARALLAGGMSASFAYEPFRDAMQWYDKAAAVRPSGNDDAILRWNSCARTIARENLEPRPPEEELPLE